MHGLINRSIQCFVTETAGDEAWKAVAGATRSGIADYESLVTYPDSETEELLLAACARLGRTRERLLEDLGSWLVTAPEQATIRRLLRFGGTDFVEFLHSLDELPGRARLAVSGLTLPAVELREHAPLTFTLTLGPGGAGFAHVLMGVLQGMAEDYGVPAKFGLSIRPGGEAVLRIRVFRTDHARGRPFDLTLSPP